MFLWRSAWGGIGACLVCVCKKTGGAENARVSKDGPVFEIGEVEI
ncbi:MAG: hypothetical protein ACLRTQ_07990 [Candidatus Borkfalkia sp.]